MLVSLNLLLAKCQALSPRRLGLSIHRKAVLQTYYLRGGAPTGVSPVKCIDCLEDFTEPEKLIKIICEHCKGPMHAECAVELGDLLVCEQCQEDPEFGALLGRAGGVA